MVPMLLIADASNQSEGLIDSDSPSVISISYGEGLLFTRLLLVNMGKASGSPKNPLRKEQVGNNEIEVRKASSNNHIIPANTFAQADTHR